MYSQHHFDYKVLIANLFALFSFAQITQYVQLACGVSALVLYWVTIKEKTKNKN